MHPLIWELFYLLGRPPWDTGITPPEVVEVVEGGQVPPGRALDIGCGTGTNAIYLAQHGFQAVGVDVSRLAIRQARRKARQAGVAVTFHRGDILKLGTPQGPPIGGPFGLALDIGCFHGLEPSDRPAYATMLRRVLRTGGFYLLYAWGPRTMRGRPMGLTPEEMQRLLGEAFHALWIRAGEERGHPSYWYLFQRLAP
ncbi:MAG: class I SAM-dependent methyltransferase [Chloroflexi bacterium]|nr:MAG: class I SAM-dependent methyltransferase [Chloroflexota bacterium]